MVSEILIMKANSLPATIIIQPCVYKDIPFPANPSPVEAWWWGGLSNGWIGKIDNTYVAMDDGQLYRVIIPAPEFVIAYEQAKQSAVISIADPDPAPKA